MSLKQNLLILCGHYKGIDQRIRDIFITKEVSIGSYVLSGGELGAAVLVDAVVRLLPGVLNDETSALTDSFQDNLLAPPVYTRPENYKGHKVPEILLSGNPKLIEEWRLEKAIENTKLKRPDLLD
jgi:tRNA (guanine37-N1)-methyltransferase